MSEWKPPPAPSWDDLCNENFRLRAALAEAERRIKHMSGVLVDAESLLGVEETGELILRPIERLQADIAAAREIIKDLIQHFALSPYAVDHKKVDAITFLERTATEPPK